MILLSFSWEYNLRKTENRSGNGKFSHLVWLFWDRQRQREQDGDKRECGQGKDVAQITEKKRICDKTDCQHKTEFQTKRKGAGVPVIQSNS